MKTYAYIYLLITFFLFSCDFDNNEVNKNYNLKISLNTDLNIVLKWDSLKLNSEIKNYEVYKSEDNENFNKITAIPFNKNSDKYSYIDIFTIDGRKTYYYKVRAITIIGKEDYSKTVTYKANTDIDKDGFIDNDCAANIKEINPDATEICDAKDNNCDGKIDDVEDIITGIDEGICQKGIKRCIDGSFKTIQEEIKPQREICDGKDNDCNGEIDDNIEEIITGTDKGECQKGIKRCINHTLVTIQEEIGPQPELCDGKDNNCNGLIDDNLYQECQSLCQSGQRICITGHWLGCNAPREKADYWIANAPIKRTYFAQTVSIENKKFIFGGKTPSGEYQNDLWIYYENQNSWEKLISQNNEPSPRIYSSITYDKQSNKIYLYGGIDENQTIKDDFWVFDLNNKTWQEISVSNSINLSLYGCVLMSDGVGNIILFGGKSDNSINNLTYRYSISQNKWFVINGDTSPQASYNQTKVYNAITNSFYVFGGNLGNDIMSNNLWKFDLMTFKWSLESDDENIPATELTAGYERNNILYFFGGKRENALTEAVYKYNLTLKQWTTSELSGIGNTVSSSVFGYKDDKFLIWGGRNEYGNITDKDLIYDLTDNTYHIKEEITSIYKPASAYDNIHKNYYLFGGYFNGSFNNNLWKYSIESNTWTRIETTLAPSPREGAALTYSEEENSLYLFGGRNDTNNYGDLWKFDLNSNTWEFIYTTSGPLYRTDAYLFSRKGNIYLFGGYEETSKTDIYILTNENKWEKIDYLSFNYPENRSNYSVIYSLKNDYLIIFGGKNENGKLNDLWLFDLNTNQWLTYYLGIIKPEKRDNAMLLYDFENDSVYLLGGKNSEERTLSDLWSLEIGGTNWTLIKEDRDYNNFNEREGYKAFTVNNALNNFIYVVGGKNNNYYYLPDKLKLYCEE